MTGTFAGGEPCQTFILTYSEVCALTALLTASVQRVELAVGRNTQVWLMLNSLRTCFAEAGYGMSGETDQHPCRACDRMPWEHPQGDCEEWH